MTEHISRLAVIAYMEYKEVEKQSSSICFHRFLELSLKPGTLASASKSGSSLALSLTYFFSIQDRISIIVGAPIGNGGSDSLLISPSVFEAAAIRRSNQLKSSNLITLHPQSSSFCRITQQDIAGHKGTIRIGDVQALHFEVGSLGIIQGRFKTMLQV